MARRAAFAWNVGPSVRQLTALMRPSPANEIMASSMSAFMPKSSPHTITCLIKNSPRPSISARPHARPVQTTRFVAVGCAAAATHWAVAVGCVELAGAPPLVANLIGWLVAFAVSFIGHYRLTFRHSRIPWTIAIRRFFLVSAAGFLVNEGAYAWLLHATALRYDVLLALILIGLAVLTFVVSRLWAFRHKPAA